MKENIYKISTKEKDTAFTLLFSEPEKKNDKYISYILNSTNDNLLLQCNGKLTTDPLESNCKFSHDLQIFSAIEEQCSKACEENSLQWFGKQINSTAINSNHSPSDNGNSLTANTDADTKFYNKLSKEVETISDNSEVICLFEPRYIWFSRKNWGVHWYLHQAKLNNNFKLQECAIQDDPEDDFEVNDEEEDCDFFTDI